VIESLSSGSANAPSPDSDPAVHEVADAASDVTAGVVADAEIVPAAVEPPLPKPATWTVREPESAWCPPEFEAALTEAIGDVATRELLARDPHRTTRHATTAAWHVAGAMRRGRRHAHMAAYCEDAMYQHLGASRGVLVVADGAGSATWSRLGSAVAVEVIGTALRDAPVLTDALLVAAVARATDVVAALAARTGVDRRALRTTVLAAAWDTHAEGTRVFTTQVGDGALVLAHRDGRITRPAAGDSGDWSGEVHCFLPDPETVERARAAALSFDVPDLAAILLVSDGVDDAFYPFPKHAPAILGQLVHGANAPLTGLAAQAVTPPLFASPDPGATLHDWLGFEKRGENDDRTLVVALHPNASQWIAPWAPSASA
jgi:hypothetical protein